MSEHPSTCPICLAEGPGDRLPCAECDPESKVLRRRSVIIMTAEQLEAAERLAKWCALAYLAIELEATAPEESDPTAQALYVAQLRWVLSEAPENVRTLARELEAVANREQQS